MSSPRCSRRRGRRRGGSASFGPCPAWTNDRLLPMPSIGSLVYFWPNSGFFQPAKAPIGNFVPASLLASLCFFPSCFPLFSAAQPGVVKWQARELDRRRLQQKLEALHRRIADYQEHFPEGQDDATRIARRWADGMIRHWERQAEQVEAALSELG